MNTKLRGFFRWIPRVMPWIWSMAVPVCIVSLMSAGCGGEETPLERLDSIIPERARYASGREIRIRRSLADLDRVREDSDAYNIGRSLYSAYSNYRVDSALWIAGYRHELALRGNDPLRLHSAELNLAECLSASADYGRALEILDSQDRSSLRDYHLGYLYKVYRETYRRLSGLDGLESNRERYRMLYRQYQDSGLSVLSRDNPRYHWLKASRLADEGHPEEALAVIEAAVRRFGPIDDNEGVLYSLGMIYHALGRDSEAVDALARSSLLYIRDGRRDYPSLMQLAGILNGMGDYDRAYRYISAALEDASFSNSRSRTSEILELVPLISSAYAAMQRESVERAWRLSGIIVLLALGLGVCAWWAFGELRRNRRLGRCVEEANAGLRDSNARLSEANRDKIAFINQLFAIHSDYIERIDAYRKKIIRFLKTSQPGAALDYVEGNRIVSEELRGMYRRFDAMFLRMYPDFVADYNARVSDNERLAPDTVTLPAKVRVLALMRIGITEPVAIARLLHYTPQTVYNYCSQLRASGVYDAKKG